MGKRLQLNSASYMFNVHERLPILPHNLPKPLNILGLAFQLVIVLCPLQNTV